MQTPASILVGSALLGAVLVVPQTARAGIDACNDINVSAQAECELVTSGGCEAMCTPLALEAACSGRLAVECDGECSASASVECTASCEADCVGRCELDPPAFECRGECVASCEGSCEASCSSDDSACMAACRGTCGGHCDLECGVTPPSADCNVQCEASCSGSCEAEANIDCQVDCQAEGFASCEAELRGGCEVQCTQPEGALFCDGQYVDAGNNLEQCIAAIEAAFDIEVEGHASGECNNGVCTGEADGTVSCAVDPGANPGGWALAWFGVIGSGMWMVGRRSRRS